MDVRNSKWHNPKEEIMLTKGDFNNIPDSPVYFSQIKYKVVAIVYGGLD